MSLRRLSLFAILNSLFATSALAGPRLMVISIDGLRPDAITQDVAPNMLALRESGTRARLALNDMPSATLPNHATMLTGLVSDHHGLNIDFQIPGKIPQPTLFDFTAAAGLHGAFLASKTKLGFLAHDDALETTYLDGSMSGMVDTLLPLLVADGPDVLFVHFRDPDSTGHAAGWMSEPYLQAVTWVDDYIGEIRDAIAADDSRGTYIIFTADHGGEGNNHFLNTQLDRTIPWFVVGPDIPAGQVLEETVSNVDTMPTALWLLGLDVPPGLDGKVRTELKDASAADAEAFPPVAPVGIPCILFTSPALFALLLIARRPSRERQIANNE